ncbi:MAG: agmatine deiminase family protein [Spirochaetales bacterium]|nr:agmatine deiminase family protein [Leptospiraceae bacterium]MCP5480251.1 agmatine deiminase family protein [Spirochaetales bacterium]MCP5486350.1 agmatine deiminase family protein [Spirochaetales bacterium]
MPVQAQESGSRAPVVRWPAEWEPHARTWLAWPARPELWDGRLPEIQDTWIEIIHAIARDEPVALLVNDAGTRNEVRRRSGLAEDRLQIYQIPTDDAWMRDYGPIWRDGVPTALRFLFNGWGDKYRPWSQDRSAGKAILDQTGHPEENSGLVFEGGAIEGNGDDIVLSTRSCALNPNRGNDLSENQWTTVFRHELGAKRVVWLESGLPFDDTDGHIDMFARFAPGRRLLVGQAPAGHAHFEALKRARATLERELPDYAIVPVPAPPAKEFAGRILPRTHLNFYVTNGSVLAPVYNEDTDAPALESIARCFEGRRIVPIYAGLMILEGGAIHCMTMQEPQLRNV